MAIAAAPLISQHLRADCLNAVIMQIEIEQETKEEVKGKGMQEYTLRIPTFIFASTTVFLEVRPVIPESDRHHRAFYPAVPTPPPNA